METIDTTTPVDVQIRWMIRRNLPDVLLIEQACFGSHAWSEDDFIACLRQRNCIGMVAEIGEKIIGYMVYELHKCKLQVLNFAVAPDHQRRGVGRAMSDKLKAKLHDSRTRIVAEVRERNVTGQLFFRAMGFRVNGILKGYYDDVDDDCYLFNFRTQGGVHVGSQT